MVDISGAAADYMNVGGKLHHSTRRIRKIGISGYRLIAPGNDGNATRETPLDKFLSNERRSQDQNISFWDWAKMCNCHTSNKCNSDHAPMFRKTLPKHSL